MLTTATTKTCCWLGSLLLLLVVLTTACLLLLLCFHLQGTPLTGLKGKCANRSDPQGLLLVGIPADLYEWAKNTKQLPGPKFYRHLHTLVILTAAGEEYRPVTKKILAKKQPKPGWNLPEEGSPAEAGMMEANYYKQYGEYKMSRKQREEEEAAAAAAEEEKNELWELRLQLKEKVKGKKKKKKEKDQSSE